MSVRLAQLVYANEPDYTYTGTDLTDNNVHETDVLAAIRQILRERSDCDQIPVVNGVRFTMSPNKWGDNFIIDVTYSKQGYRALYGGRLDTHLHDLTCYMD